MYQIFISVRFVEAGNEAKVLKSALEAKGISTFLCDVRPGGDIASEIVNALDGCQLAIIMGTRTYGKDTGVGYSTFEELRFIHKRIPFFLIKMCDEYDLPETTFRLGDAVSYFPWNPSSSMPDDLVNQISERLASATHGSSSPVTPQVATVTEERKKAKANYNVCEEGWKADDQQGKGEMMGKRLKAENSNHTGPDQYLVPNQIKVDSWVDDDLNPSQKQAVECCLNTKHIGVIHGPVKTEFTSSFLSVCHFVCSFVIFLISLARGELQQ
jgi:hypothetical protein